MTQKDIFGNETKFFEKASFFNGAELTGNIVIDGNLRINGSPYTPIWSVGGSNIYYTNGNVGIGTDNPTEKLEVAGHVKIDSGPVLENSESGNSLLIRTPSGYCTIGPNNSSYTHFYTDRGRFFFNNKLVVDSGIFAAYDEDLHLATNSTGSDIRLTILNSNGNVGINSTIPAKTLDVVGSIRKTEYEPGEIIETISSSCDGSTVVVRSGSYDMANVTAVQNGTNTFTTITGSEISYTPPAGTKRVYYRFWYHFDVTENSGISNHILQIDGTEVYPSANTISSNYASTNWHHAGFPVSVEYTINCDADSDDANNGKFTSWTSAKTLRVQYREHSGSYESRLHYNTWWEGAASAADYQIMKPHLTIQAIA